MKLSLCANHENIDALRVVFLYSWQLRYVKDILNVAPNKKCTWCYIRRPGKKKGGGWQGNEPHHLYHHTQSTDVDTHCLGNNRHWCSKRGCLSCWKMKFSELAVSSGNNYTLCDIQKTLIFNESFICTIA